MTILSRGISQNHHKYTHHGPLLIISTIGSGFSTCFEVVVVVFGVVEEVVVSAGFWRGFAVANPMRLLPMSNSV